MVNVGDFNYSLTPFIRTNIGDLFNYYGRDRGKQRECGEIELDALECLEAYGKQRGSKLCMPYIEDFQECLKTYIQKQRATVMKRERIKQVLRGERKISETYDNIKPPRDAFQFGPFYN